MPIVRMRRALALLLVLACACTAAPRAVRAAGGATAMPGQMSATEAAARVKLPVGKEMAAVRARIAAWCAQADAALAQAGVQASLGCVLAAEEGAWQVLTLQAFTGGEPLPLALIRFDPAEGEVRLPDPAVLAALADADFLRAVLALAEVGIALEPAWHAQRATPALVLRWLTQAYEALGARAVDAQGVLWVPDAPEAVRKAAALGIWNPAEDGRLDAALARQELLSLLWRWIARVERDLYRTAALPATVADARRALQCACDLAGVPVAVDAVWTVAPEEAQAPLSRQAFARGLVAVYEALHGAQQLGAGLWAPMLDDTDDSDARKACGLGLMDYVRVEPHIFFSFDPDRVMSGEAVYAHALRFAEACLTEHGAHRLTAAPLRVAEAAALTHRALAGFAGRVPVAEPTLRVDNAGQSDWYAAQEETGVYSATNCMPAAAAMVLRWARPGLSADVETLRALYPLEGAAWYPEQVMDVLDAYGVAYTLADIDRASLLTALDAGHILLVLLNEGFSGHCVVVHGYVREGEGLWFVVHDPASPSDDAYGRPVGRDRWMEASYLLWAMECHWWRCFDIAPQGTAT